MPKNNQMIIRPKKGTKQVTVRDVATQLGKDALVALIKSNGMSNVAYEIARGGINLSRAAAQWWAQRSASAPQDIVTTEAPVTLGAVVRGSPKFNGNIRIKHRELVAASAINQSWRINPVDGTTFPYLSTLATMFDKYRMHSLCFVVVSANSTVNGGRWYIAFDPDSSDTPPTNQIDYMSMRDSLSMGAWQSGNLTVKVDKSVKFCSYVTDSLKDVGRLTLQPVGSLDLYVEYDVELIDPQNSSPAVEFSGSTLTTSILGSPSTRIGADYARIAGNGNYDLANGFYQFSSYIKGTECESNACSITNGIIRTRHSGSTTELWQYGIVDANLSGDSRLDFNSTATTVTGSSLVITRISRAQYDNIFAMMP